MRIDAQRSQHNPLDQDEVSRATGLSFMIPEKRTSGAHVAGASRLTTSVRSRTRRRAAISSAASRISASTASRRGSSVSRRSISSAACAASLSVALCGSNGTNLLLGFCCSWKFYLKRPVGPLAGGREWWVHRAHAGVWR